MHATQLNWRAFCRRSSSGYLAVHQLESVPKITRGKVASVESGVGVPVACSRTSDDPRDCPGTGLLRALANKSGGVCTVSSKIK